MNAQTTPTDEPARHGSLAAALAAFQAHLPVIGKDNTATVPTKTGGSYQYKYADLSDVSRAVLPALARHGLSFSTKPTMTEDGHFVLAYVLRHESGEEDSGIYPLPSGGTPQSVGSALTYARRYVLSAMTGVAPDEDDDGQAAQHATYDRPPVSRSQEARGAAQNGRQASAGPARDTRPPADDAAPSEADKARAALRAHCGKQGYDMARVAARFEAMYEGRKLRTDDDANRITAFTKLLDGMPEAELRPEVAANGVAQ